MPGEFRRKTPEEFLLEAQAEERASKKGYLKIFLGYASGVGKSFRMFDEARRRRERGQDIVVGAVQPKVPADIEPLLANLEVIPMKNGIEVDADRLIRRHPSVCVIDGLAYDNPPGARNQARWMDVRDLLDAGIKVITSINVQYIDEMREQVEAITGKHVSQTVPILFIKSADEIEVVDAPADDAAEITPERQRLARLRELALVLAADVVDQELENYLLAHGVQQRLGTHERVMVCITPRANAREMIDAGRHIADRFHAELIVAYVAQPGISPADQAALDERLGIARDAGATIEMLEGEDAVDTIMDFAHARGITQLFIGHTQRTGLRSKLWGNPVDRFIRRSHGMDLWIFPQ